MFIMILLSDSNILALVIIMKQKSTHVRISLSREGTFVKIKFFQKMIKFKIEIICNDKLGVQWTKNVS